jgi:tetratricopeptide (TPR) repeat protein
VNHAIGLRADRAAAWQIRTLALIYLERYQEALQSADRTLAIGLDSPEIWVLRAVALNRLGQYQACYASYEKALGREYRSWSPNLRQMLHRKIHQMIEKVKYWTTAIENLQHSQKEGCQGE